MQTFTITITPSDDFPADATKARMALGLALELAAQQVFLGKDTAKLWVQRTRDSIAFAAQMQIAPVETQDLQAVFDVLREARGTIKAMQAGKKLTVAEYMEIEGRLNQGVGAMLLADGIDTTHKPLKHDAENGPAHGWQKSDTQSATGAVSDPVETVVGDFSVMMDVDDKRNLQIRVYAVEEGETSDNPVGVFDVSQ